MADEEQLAILKKGADAWNAWRRGNPGARPDLRHAFRVREKANLVDANLSEANFLGADLSEAYLSRANFREANLSEVDLRYADLSGADLRGAYLNHTNLSEANLSEADLRYADLGGADLRGTDLSKAHFNWANFSRVNFSGMNFSGMNLSGAYLCEADLSETDLSETDLGGADLSRADLSRADLHDAAVSDANLTKANLRDADLRGTDLSGADLSEADLSEADLHYADLRKANLTGAHLSGAHLSETDMSEAIIGWNVFADADLSEIHGLGTVIHRGPSTIGINTIYKSHGNIPEVFLRGCGVPDTFIEYMASLVGKPIEFYSCFISYSTRNQDFAQRLHNDLQAKGVRCWFAPEDIQGGKKLHEQIEEAIRLYDKLLLVLSDHSMNSDWVKTEIYHARQQEINRNRRKLFPVSLVPFETIRAWRAFDADSGKDMAREVREYFVPDFSNWKDHDAYQKAFDRLVRDLKAEPVNKESRD